MSGFADYERYDALGLAELVRRKDVSPAELLEAAIERVEARNAAVNAVVMPLYDYGRKAIEDGLPDGPFRGVPFLLKDLGGWLAGVKVTRGSRFFADAPAATADSEHVRRLKRAGLVIFGRTNSCELGLSLTCEPALFGPTKSPWDTTRISGGSSGGAAAAVGARMLPMAHASDGFGSIRAPASCCGIVGLKPTRSRNTMAPYAGEGPGRHLHGARRDPLGARFRGAARRDVRRRPRRSLRRAQAGTAVPPMRSPPIRASSGSRSRASRPMVRRSKPTACRRSPRRQSSAPTSATTSRRPIRRSTATPWSRRFLRSLRPTRS